VIAKPLLQPNAQLVSTQQPTSDKLQRKEIQTGQQKNRLGNESTSVDDLNGTGVGGIDGEFLIES